MSQYPSPFVLYQNKKDQQEKSIKIQIEDKRIMRKSGTTYILRILVTKQELAKGEASGLKNLINCNLNKYV